jgi:hypothetical protein
VILTWDGTQWTGFNFIGSCFGMTIYLNCVGGTPLGGGTFALTWAIGSPPPCDQGGSTLISQSCGPPLDVIFNLPMLSCCGGTIDTLQIEITQ